MTTVGWDERAKIFEHCYISNVQVYNEEAYALYTADKHPWFQLKVNQGFKIHYFWVGILSKCLGHYQNKLNYNYSNYNGPNIFP